MPEPTEWLTTAHNALVRRINEAVEKYDNAQLTLDDMKLFIRSITLEALTQTSDHAFSDGLEAAELDGDTEDDEVIEFDFDEEDDENDA